jgi:hypothetical protein
MFLVRLSHTGPQWDRARPMEEQSQWLAHASYRDRLVNEGIIVLGDLLDNMRVVLAMEAECPEAVSAILELDPWSRTACGSTRSNRGRSALIAASRSYFAAP